MSSTNDYGYTFYGSTADVGDYYINTTGTISSSYDWLGELIYCPILEYYLTNRDICEKICKKRNCVNKEKK